MPLLLLGVREITERGCCTSEAPTPARRATAPSPRTTSAMDVTLIRGIETRAEAAGRALTEAAFKRFAYLNAYLREASAWFKMI
jgi:hypothetical protein